MCAGPACAGRVQLVLGGAGADTDYKFMCRFSQARGAREAGAGMINRPGQVSSWQPIFPTLSQMLLEDSWQP